MIERDRTGATLDLLRFASVTEHPAAAFGSTAVLETPRWARLTTPRRPAAREK
jgi:hypothetical protein